MAVGIRESDGSGRACARELGPLPELRAHTHQCRAAAPWQVTTLCMAIGEEEGSWEGEGDKVFLAGGLRCRGLVPLPLPLPLLRVQRGEVFNRKRREKFPSWVASRGSGRPRARACRSWEALNALAGAGLVLVGPSE